MSVLPDFSMDYLPHVRDDLTVSDVEGELVVLDQLNGKVHQLNHAGTVVFGCCNGSNSIREIQERLIEYFDVTPDVALRDLKHLLQTLHDHHLLTS